MKIRRLGLALAIVVATSAAAQMPTAVEVPPGDLALDDVAFIKDANTSNITQMMLGRTAATKGSNPGIHSLADRIVASHHKADDALQLIASRKHVDVARWPTEEDQAEVDDLTARNRGGNFDAQYVRDVIDDHDRMIGLYEAARQSSDDPDIRRYADIMLPALRENRDQALALVAKQPGADRTHVEY